MLFARDDYSVVPFSWRALNITVALSVITAVGLDLPENGQESVYLNASPAELLSLLVFAVLFLLFFGFVFTHAMLWLLRRLRYTSYPACALASVAVAVPVNAVLTYFIADGEGWSLQTWIAIDIGINAISGVVYRYAAGTRPRDGIDVGVF